MDPVANLVFDPLFEWAFSEVPNRGELDAQVEVNEVVVAPDLAVPDET